ncbi:MAG: glycosyltransferase family 9 protein [Telluria sp.]
MCLLKTRQREAGSRTYRTGQAQKWKGKRPGSRARLLLCNDTGVSHIAAGLKLSSVVIFSKADIRRWAPVDQERHRCLWDPDGARACAVLREACALLDG